MDNTCVCCGKIIPEGLQVCPSCQSNVFSTMNKARAVFEVSGKPLGKQRPRVTVIQGHGRAYTPEQTVNYENYIKMCYLKHQNGDLYDKPLRMAITAVYEIPKSFSNVKRKTALADEKKPLTKPDVDNVAKVVCDALNGIAYKDDSQIVELRISKHYGEQPKIVVSIEEV